MAYWLIEKKPLAREYFENGKDSIDRQYRNDFPWNDSFMSVERQANHAHDAWTSSKQLVTWPFYFGLYSFVAEKKKTISHLY